MGDYNVMLLRINNSKDKEIKNGVYEIHIKNFDIFEYGWRFYINSFLEDIFDKCELKFEKLLSLYQDKLKYFSYLDYVTLIDTPRHWTQYLSGPTCIWELSFKNRLNWFDESILVDVDFNINTIFLARRIFGGCTVPIPPITDCLSKKLLEDNTFTICIDYNHFTNMHMYNQIEFIDDFNKKIDFSTISIKKENSVKYFDYDMIDNDFEDYMNGEKTFLYDIKQHSHIISDELNSFLIDHDNEVRFYRQLGFYIPNKKDNLLPNAVRCYKCGKLVHHDDDFILAFEKEDSKESKDFIIFPGLCDDCQIWENKDDNRRIEELKNNYDSDYGDWKY